MRRYHSHSHGDRDYSSRSRSRSPSEGWTGDDSSHHSNRSGSRKRLRRNPRNIPTDVVEIDEFGRAITREKKVELRKDAEVAAKKALKRKQDKEKVVEKEAKKLLYVQKQADPRVGDGDQTVSVADIIPGYENMTPMQRLKARTQFQLGSVAGVDGGLLRSRASKQSDRMEGASSSNTAPVPRTQPQNHPAAQRPSSSNLHTSHEKDSERATPAQTHPAADSDTAVQPQRESILFFENQTSEEVHANIVSFLQNEPRDGDDSDEDGPVSSNPPLPAWMTDQAQSGVGPAVSTRDADYLYEDDEMVANPWHDPTAAAVVAKTMHMTSAEDAAEDQETTDAIERAAAHMVDDWMNPTLRNVQGQYVEGDVVAGMDTQAATVSTSSVPSEAKTDVGSGLRWNRSGPAAPKAHAGGGLDTVHEEAIFGVSAIEAASREASARMLQSLGLSKSKTAAPPDAGHDIHGGGVSKIGPSSHDVELAARRRLAALPTVAPAKKKNDTQAQPAALEKRPLGSVVPHELQPPGHNVASSWRAKRLAMLQKKKKQTAL